MTQPATQPIDYTPQPSPRPSKTAFIIGWILSAIPALFLGMALVMMFNPKMVLDSMIEQGFTQPRVAMWVVLWLEVLCAVIYLIPRTAVLGAVLLTGFFGGAIATHLRLAEYPQMLPAVVLGIFTWLGLFLRDRRIRALLPLRTPHQNPDVATV